MISVVELVYLMVEDNCFAPQHSLFALRSSGSGLLVSVGRDLAVPFGVHTSISQPVYSIHEQRLLTIVLDLVVCFVSRVPKIDALSARSWDGHRMSLIAATS